MILQPQVPPEVEALAKQLFEQSCAARGTAPKFGWRGRRTNRAYYRRIAAAQLRRASLSPTPNAEDRT